MKKLNAIVTIAIFSISGAVFAGGDKSGFNSKHANYHELLKRYDRECQIPWFGTWFANKYQIEGCQSMIRALDDMAEQNIHYGPKREFWKRLSAEKGNGKKVKKEDDTGFTFNLEPSYPDRPNPEPLNFRQERD